MFARYKGLVKYWLTFNEIDSVFRHPFTTIGIVPDRYPREKLEEIIYQCIAQPVCGQRSGSQIPAPVDPGGADGLYADQDADLPGKLSSPEYAAGLENQPGELLLRGHPGVRRVPKAYSKRLEAEQHPGGVRPWGRGDFKVPHCGLRVPSPIT